MSELEMLLEQIERSEWRDIDEIFANGADDSIDVEDFDTDDLDNI